MDISGYPARTRAGALIRGAVRAAVLFGLAAIAGLMSVDESSAGNRTFLWCLAAFLAVVGAWGLVETIRELSLSRARSPRGTR
jgi:hypothetical protein